MVHWAWLIVALLIGCAGGIICVACLAFASKAGRCEDCLLYEQFLEKRQEAVAKYYDESLGASCGYFAGSLSDPRD